MKITWLIVVLLLISEYTNAKSYPLGATVVSDGAVFRVWAPNASLVKVKSASSNWAETQLSFEKNSGIWSGEVLGALAGDRYSYSITYSSTNLGTIDPNGRQTYQKKWSVLVDPNAYTWHDSKFVGQPLDSAVIYELHVGSFNPHSKSPWGTYSSVIDKLDYLAKLGINYLELLPVHKSARPFDWGYGVSSPDALEDTYGSPDDLRRLVDQAHQRGIGILLDVVHNHYSGASALRPLGLYFYSGEHGLTKWGPRPNFNDLNVRNFIFDNINQYLNEYHIDGFRWDAATYITKYMDYDIVTKKERNNGNNPDGVSLLQQINEKLHLQNGVISIAEYFGAPPLVTQPPSSGGLGFDSHWAGFFPVVSAITQSSQQNINIQNIADALIGSNTRIIFTESHDEVGHPPVQRRIPTRIDSTNPGSLVARKRSLLGAALLMTTPGVPMIFQGQEFLESQDFSFPTGTPLDWSKATTYAGIVSSYQDLIALRKSADGKTDALKVSNIEIFHQNEGAKVIAFRRWDKNRSHEIVVLANFSIKSFSAYKIGLPHGGQWSVIFTSDNLNYSPDFGNTPHIRNFSASNYGYDNLPNSTTVELAPFTAIVLRAP